VALVAAAGRARGVVLGGIGEDREFVVQLHRLYEYTVNRKTPRVGSGLQRVAAPVNAGVGRRPYDAHDARALDAAQCCFARGRPGRRAAVRAVLPGG
jgi:hypothetical protein